MYTPVYGNFLGVVINTQDPESRGRLQIFVPNISTTLFKNWNEPVEGEYQDISLKYGDISTLNPDVKQRLIKLLPWAECAMPLFGFGGSTYTDNKTNQVKPQSFSPEPINSVWNQNITSDAPKVDNTPPAASSGNCDENLKRIIAAIGYRETGYSVKEAETDTYNNPYDPRPNVRNNEILRKIKSGMSESQARYEGSDYGFFQTNGENNKLAASVGVGPLNYGSAAQQSKNVGLFIQNYLDKKQGNTKGVMADICAGNWEAAQNKLSNFWPSLPRSGRPQSASFHADKNSVSNAILAGGTTAESQRYLALSQSDNISSKNKYAPEGGNNVSSSGPTPTAPATTGEKMQPVLVGKHIDPTAPSAPHDLREPQGINSTPSEGSMVWVFFYGGDVQKPVYFAGVKEPNASARTDAGAPVGV